MLFFCYGCYWCCWLKTERSSQFGHKFDLSQTMSPAMLESVTTVCFNPLAQQPPVWCVIIVQLQCCEKRFVGLFNGLNGQVHIKDSCNVMYLRQHTILFSSLDKYEASG